MEQQLVVFELSNEHYGVNIASVESIIKMQPITVVPHAPSFVEGVTNLRGSVLPVIDLRKRFGLENEGTTKNSRIVVVAIDGVEVGMIVDAVSEVLRIPEDAIEPPPPMVTTVDSTFITGIAKVGDRLVILLDLGRVLSLQEKGDLVTLPSTS
jgi:purine-binding chemotaxis protein CheW